MNCWRTRQILAAYLDGELSPAETELIEDHLRACPECEELRDRIASIPPLDLPRLEPDAEAEIWSRMDDALEAAWQRHERGEERGATTTALAGLRGWLRNKRLAIPIPVAAAYVVIILGLTGWNLVTFQRVQNLSAQLDPTSERVALQPSDNAPIIRAPGNLLPAGGLPGLTTGHGMSASVSLSSLERVSEEPPPEEPPPLSIPVYDSTTGAVIYHVVDQAPAIGY